MRRRGDMEEGKRTMRNATAARRCCRLGLCCVMVAALGAGCGGDRKAALTDEEIERLTYARRPNRPDELHVSGETVTCEDIMMAPFDRGSTESSLRETLVELARQAPFEKYMEWARPQVRKRLNENIAYVILYKQAGRELGDKTEEQLDKLADKELRKFVLEHGGNGAAADAALQKLGMNRASYKEYKKKQVLGQYYVASKYPYNRPITHSELLEQYDKMKDPSFSTTAMVQFRLIDIQIDRVELTDGNDDPLQVARSLASDLLARLKTGEDFGELAKQHSHGHRSELGGLWTPRDPAAFAPPYDVLAARCQEMKAGEVAGPIETLGHIFILRLEQKQDKGYQPLSEVQDTVRTKIMEGRQHDALQQLNAEIAQQASLANTDHFLDYCLERLYRMAVERADPNSPPAREG